MGKVNLESIGREGDRERKIEKGRKKSSTCVQHIEMEFEFAKTRNPKCAFLENE